MYDEEDEVEAPAPSPRGGALAAAGQMTEAPDAAPATGGALGQLAYAPGLSAEELMAEARKYVNPKTKWSGFVTGALAPTRTGQFSESLGNAYGKYAEGLQKEDELTARYLPVVQRAAMVREQQRIQQQQRSVRRCHHRLALAQRAGAAVGRAQPGASVAGVKRGEGQGGHVRP